MRGVGFLYMNDFRSKRRGFEVCIYCDEEEDICETRLERCF